MTPKLSGLALFSLVLIAGQALADPTTPPLTTGKSGSVDAGVHTVLGDRAPKVPGRPAVAPLPDGGYRLIWADLSTDEVGFMVERYPAFPEGPTRQVGANVTELIDTQDIPKARYRVRALGERLHSRWTTWAQGTSMTAGFVTLTPGGGFSGPTPQPPPVGTADMAGFDAKAIARWDAVPYQTFTGNYYIGVPAFHMNGIDRVDFSVNGGPWKSVREMKQNPQTGVWEYPAILKASLFNDGPVEVRAVVWPRDAGQPRVLGGAITPESTLSGEFSMNLTANSHRTIGGAPRWVDPNAGDDNRSGLSAAQAVRTLGAAARAIRLEKGTLDGGLVYLMNGNHDWSFASAPGNNSFASITFEAAPESTPGAVRLADRPDVSGNEPRILLVTFRGVTVAQNISDTTFAGSGLNQLWVDRCTFGSGSLTTVMPSWTANEWELGVYATNCTFLTGRDGLSNVRLARGIRMQQIGEDAFKNVPCIINARVDTMICGDSSYHADVIQYTGPWKNTIVYGLRAPETGEAQTIFSREAADRHDDAAFVNVYLDQGPDAAYGQWLRNSNHVLFWHWTSFGTPFLFRETNPGGGEPLVVTNLSVRNSVFSSVDYPATRYPNPMNVFHNNHFVRGTMWGTEATGGDIVGYTNDSSVIDGRVSSFAVPVDAVRTPLSMPASIGALQPPRNRDSVP